MALPPDYGKRYGGAVRQRRWDGVSMTKRVARTATILGLLMLIGVSAVIYYCLRRRSPARA